MQVSVIIAHPGRESFNHAIAEATVNELKKNRYNVFFHDLYAENFDPVLPAAEIPEAALLHPEINRHCREVSGSDGIVIIHPNWWGQPPAILKGWVDRVIRPGIAYRFEDGDQGEGVPVGLLKAKNAIVFNTSNTMQEREREVFGDPLETLWKNCIFGLCGVTNVYREMFSVVVTSTAEQRSEWLAKVRQTVRHVFPK